MRVSYHQEYKEHDNKKIDQSRDKLTIKYSLIRDVLYIFHSEPNQDRI